MAGAVPLGGMRITAPDGTVLEGRYPTAGAWRPTGSTRSRFRARRWTRILLERLRALPVDFRERVRVTACSWRTGAWWAWRPSTRTGGHFARAAGHRRGWAGVGRGASARAASAAPLQRMALVTYVAGSRA